MNIGLFLAIAAAIAIIYGVAFIVAPDFVLITYGMMADAALSCWLAILVSLCSGSAWSLG